MLNDFNRQISPLLHLLWDFSTFCLSAVCRSGYLLFGKSAHWIILRNLMKHCKDIGLFCDLVCLFFVVTTWSAISPLCVRISEFIENHIIFEWLRSRRSRRIRAMKRVNSGHNIGAWSHPPPVVTAEVADVESVSQDKGSEGRSSKRKGTTTTNLTTSSSRKRMSFDDEVFIGDCTKRTCRVAVLLLLLLCSFMFRSNITFLESVVGTCFSTVTCILFPCLLYLKSFWNTLSCLRKLAHILLTVLVVIAVIALFIGCVIDRIAGDDIRNNA